MCLRWTAGSLNDTTHRTKLTRRHAYSVGRMKKKRKKHKYAFLSRHTSRCIALMHMSVHGIHLVVNSAAAMGKPDSGPHPKHELQICPELEIHYHLRASHLVSLGLKPTTEGSLSGELGTTLTKNWSPSACGPIHTLACACPADGASSPLHFL